MTLPANASNTTAQPSARPNNALLGRVRSHSPAHRAPRQLPPAAQAHLLRSAIGHAAVLSDTPEKWAATIALLKQHGVDPSGYDDFDTGRPLAIAASGVAPADDGAQDSNPQ